jgi:hypothetical protein
VIFSIEHETEIRQFPNLERCLRIPTKPATN